MGLRRRVQDESRRITQSITYGDLCTCKTRGRIQANTIATSTAVHLDLACIGLESNSSILRRNTTLDSEPATGDTLLSQTKLCEGGTGGNLDLSGNDVDTSDLLCGPNKQ